MRESGKARRGVWGNGLPQILTDSCRTLLPHNTLDRAQDPNPAAPPRPRQTPPLSRYRSDPRPAPRIHSKRASPCHPSPPSAPIWPPPVLPNLHCYTVSSRFTQWAVPQAPVPAPALVRSPTPGSYSLYYAGPPPLLRLLAHQHGQPRPPVVRRVKGAPAVVTVNALGWGGTGTQRYGCGMPVHTRQAGWSPNIPCSRTTLRVQDHTAAAAW